MFKMKSIIFTCCIFGIASALEFPSYLPRCSLSDLNISACIKEKANIAIPTLVKGDEKLGVPVMAPLHIQKAKLEGKNLVIDLKDIESNDFKDSRVTEVLFELEKKKSQLTLVMDVFNVLGEYSITDGKVLSHSISGSGKFNMTLLGLTLQYRSDIRIYEKDEEKYEEFTDIQCKMTVKRGHYVFENLKSSEKGEDVNAFIEEHWEILNTETAPSLQLYFRQIMKRALDPITKAFPLNKTFLP